MIAFEKWLDTNYIFINSDIEEMAVEGWVAALEWVKKEAIPTDERGDISREIINQELENKDVG